MPRLMEPDRWYLYGLVGLVAAGIASFLALLFVAAPYGRHERPGWGPSVPTRIAWVVQELPAPLLFAIVFLRGEHAFRPVPLAFLFLWQLHYVQRTFVFPLRMRVGDNHVPILTVLMAIAFNVTNASLNAYAISHGALRHVESWFTDPRFAIGVALFLAGWAVNLQSDAILRRLVSKLSGRDHRVVRLGARRLDLGRRRLRVLHDREPAAARAVASPLVSREVPRLPARAEGDPSGRAVGAARIVDGWRPGRDSNPRPAD
jgi:3-oxo-5-alpha-steroid 4-dehydrogenase 1